MFDYILFEDNSPQIISAVPQDLQQSYKLFETMIGFEIKQILDIHKKYNSVGHRVVNNEILTSFLDKLYVNNCPKILKYNLATRQIYILYVVGLMFYKFNDDILKMPKDDFIEQIYFPNIINICVKYTPKAKVFFHKIIKQVHEMVLEKSKDIVDFYAELYNADTEAIKNNIMYLFLITMLTQFNPLEVDKVEDFYISLFRKMFFYYLKSKTAGLTTVDVDASIIQDENFTPISERYRIYEEALCLAQIQLLCSDSQVMSKISDQYDSLKVSSIPNEIQRLYVFVANKSQSSYIDQKMLLLKTQSELNTDNIKYKLPQIYKVLKSICIVSETPTFQESDKKLVYNVVYKTLYNKFNSVLSDDVLIPIIHKISNNLVKSLTVGEFIDAVNLKRVTISIDKFNIQLAEFLTIILDNLGHDNLEKLGASYE